MRLNVFSVHHFSHTHPHIPAHSPHTGHYISDVCSFPDHSWRTYNDSQVSEVREEDIRQRRQTTGYIFFYLHRYIAYLQWSLTLSTYNLSLEGPISERIMYIIIPLVVSKLAKLSVFIVIFVPCRSIFTNVSAQFGR